MSIPARPPFPGGTLLIPGGGLGNTAISVNSGRRPSSSRRAAAHARRPAAWEAARPARSRASGRAAPSQHGRRPDRHVQRQAAVESFGGTALRPQWRIARLRFPAALAPSLLEVAGERHGLGREYECQKYDHLRPARAGQLSAHHGRRRADGHVRARLQRAGHLRQPGVQPRAAKHEHGRIPDRAARGALGALAAAARSPAIAAIGVDPPGGRSLGPGGCRFAGERPAARSFSSVPYVPSNGTTPLHRTYPGGHGDFGHKFQLHGQRELVERQRRAVLSGRRATEGSSAARNTSTISLSRPPRPWWRTKAQAPTPIPIRSVSR